MGVNGCRGPKAAYTVPRPGSKAHLLLLMMRAPAGISGYRAAELGLMPESSSFGAFCGDYLRDQCGYDTEVVSEDPGGGRGRHRHNVAVTCLYNWDGSVAVDYVAERVKRAAGS